MSRRAALALLALGCSEPAFVSLGRNVQPAARADAGALADACTPENTPDDLLLSGCEEPAPAAVCELGPDSQAVTSECNARQVVECLGTYPTDQERLDGALSALLGECSIQYHQLRVLFSSGCASAFSLESSDVAGIEAAHACVATRLGSQRYACAQSLGCGVGLWRGVPID